MQDINSIKFTISNLHNDGTEIHVDVHSTRPKISVDSAPAKITGVYKNLFTIESVEDGLKKHIQFNIPIFLLVRSE